MLESEDISSKSEIAATLRAANCTLPVRVKPNPPQTMLFIGRKDSREE